MALADFIWTFIIAFLIIAYIMIFFSIITDLFRDHTIGGFAKAMWVLFLIVVPFLAALIYLIARGGGMAQRQQAAVSAAKSETDAYIKQVAGSSTADEIAKAQALKDSGAITAAEFTELKKKALAGK
ncbi:putative PurR-regulated permease PerM [Aurantimicrobium minutum]|uniref:SHOCT domain-containing protein n=1 Tax=Aurantimicrobium minutum TaxID=708131 RepID=UPI00247317D1|nr:SHOCT domain-containing protein [Aurantimicrobium minutum]MDH6532191.1 putative PurR-regulated permease PerM [Aurantimicrobium minutum]